jgi:hypothetical protein
VNIYIYICYSRIVPQNHAGFIEKARVNLGIASGSLNLISFTKDLQESTVTLQKSENPALVWITKKKIEDASKDKSVRPIRLEITPDNADKGSLFDSGFNFSLYFCSLNVNSNHDKNC